MIWKLLGGKSSRILAITLIAGWVWQVTCTVLACREHQGVLGVAALLSLGLSAVTFIATLLPDECCRPLKSRMLPSHSYSPTSFKSCCCCKDSLFVVCFSISSCLTLVSIASEQRGASSSDIGLELSSLCLIALAAPAVLCKLCGDCGSSSLYNLSSGLGVVSVFAAWCLTQSLNLVAYIVLCILYTSTTVLLPTSTNQDLPEDEEQKRLLLRNSSSKDFRCISEISVVANSAHDLKTVSIHIYTLICRLYLYHSSNLNLIYFAL
ncbi:hypothetical protein EON65_14685 [archaeon]|nr:MAG: hypothetical protein EON65_14685 [archaeon]